MIRTPQKPAATRLIALAAFSLLGLAGGDAGAETIQTTVHTALADSPVVHQAIARTKVAASEISVARSRMLPNIMLEASVGPAYRDRSVDGTSSGSGDVLLSRRGALSISQLLFDWGASNRLVHSAKLRRLYEDLLVADAREEQAFLVADVYVSLVGARLKANVLGKKIEYLGHFADMAEKRRKNDGDTQVALLSGRLGTSRGDFEKAKGQVDALEQRFELLTTLKPTGLSLPTLPGERGSGLSLDGAPKVAAARQAVSAQGEQVRALRRDLYPTLSLELRGGLAQDSLGIEGPDNDLSALAVIRWSPFDGGRKQALLSQSKAKLMEEEAVLAEIRRVLADRVATAQAELKAATARYNQLTASIGEMDGAVSKFDALLSKEQEGTTPVSVAAIHGERNTAQLDAVDARIDQYRAAYKMLAAAGRLLEFFGISEGVQVASSADGKGTVR